MSALTRSRAAPTTDRLVFWLVIAVAWFATIGWRPLLEPDEGRYAEIPREMWVSGDWVTPRLNGVKYFEKPALQYWATAAMYSMFGVSEWTSRFWSCGLAFLCIPLTYAFARHLYGSVKIAGAAAAALALNPYFLMVAQVNLLDSALTFFLVGSMFAFLRAREAPAGSGEERRWMLITSLALALAVLSKGIVALVLSGGALIVHMLVTREVRPLRRWHLAFTVPLFLLVTVPWFVVVSARNPEFLKFFFVHEHFQRFLTTVHDRAGPWWYFFPYLLLAVLPWITLAAPAVRAVFRLGPRNSHNSVPWFLLIWCVIVFGFFSVSHSKLPPYVMPMMPAVAVLLAPHIVERAGSIRRAAWIAGGFITFVAVGLAVAGARKAGGVPTAMLVWSMVAAALALGGAWLASASAAPASAPSGSLKSVPFKLDPALAWALAALGSILGYQALMMSYSALPPVRTSKPLVAAVRPFITADTQLFSVDQYRQSVPPYLGRTLRVVRYRGELDFGFSQEQARYVPTLDAFVTEWMRARNALAFVEPGVLNELEAKGVPFRIRAADARSVVVSRE